MIFEKLGRHSRFFLPLALGLLVLNLAFSLRSWQKFGALASNVRLRADVFDHAGRLLAALGDAETGQRGFLLTGRDQYLSPYFSGKHQAPAELAVLQEVVRQSGPEQRARVEALAPLVSQKLSELRLTIDLMKSSGATAALIVVNSDVGRRSMDAIRNLCGQIQASALLQLSLDSRAAEKSFKQGIAASATGSLLVFVIFLILAVAMKLFGRANRERDRLDRELHGRRQLLETTTVELRQSLAEKIKTEDRFQLVVEAAPNAMIMVGTDGLITLVNTQAEKLFGYGRSELLGQSMDMLLPERFRGSHGGHRSGFFAAPSTRLMGAGRDLFGLRKDGSEVPVEIGLNPIVTSDGQFVLASVIDITERRKTAERFQLVVEAAPNAMIMVGTDGLITLVNTQTEKLFGYGRGELLGQSMDMLVPERFRGSHGGHRSGFFAAPSTRSMGAGRDLFGLRKDGSEVPVEIGLNPIATTDGQFVLASVIDITERKRTEERFQLLVEASPSAMIMAGVDGLITLVNTQTEILFGYDRTELMGRPMEMLVPERSRPNHGGQFRGFFTSPRTRKGAGRELPGLRKDGSEVPVEIGLNPIVTSDGQFVLASVIDITERKRVHAQLESRAAEMERFTYTVSHDLKSPLITIKSYVAMIDQDLGGANIDRARADLHRVARAADKMNQLLEELLSLSRVGRVVNAPEKVLFGSLVEEALELVAGGLSNGHVRVEVAPDLPTVTADRSRMVEVLQNLIDNACKFMGGQTDPEIRIGTSSDELETRFFVRDNGVGVEPRHHEKIFGLFDKLDPKSGGSGAGLAIVKRIIQTHGGRIWIESPGSGGSTFWFTLQAPHESAEGKR